MTYAMLIRRCPNVDELTKEWQELIGGKHPSTLASEYKVKWPEQYNHSSINE